MGEQEGRRREERGCVVLHLTLSLSAAVPLMPLAHSSYILYQHQLIAEMS
jgi:hypothetical protein